MEDLATLLGTGVDAEIVALGLLSAIEAMVVWWNSLGREDHEHVVQLITTFLSAGLGGLDLGPPRVPRPG